MLDCTDLATIPKPMHEDPVRSVKGQVATALVARGASASTTSFTTRRDPRPVRYGHCACQHVVLRTVPTASQAYGRHVHLGRLLGDIQPRLAVGSLTEELVGCPQSTGQGMTKLIMLRSSLSPKSVERQEQATGGDCVLCPRALRMVAKRLLQHPRDCHLSTDNLQI